MEDFIMEQIISACITGAAAVVGVILMEWLFGKRILDLLSKHDETSNIINKDLSKEHNDLSKEHNGLSKEHNGLSKEHVKISINQKNISEKQNEMLNKINSIDKLVSEEKVAQSLRYENLTDKQKDIKLYITKIEDMAIDWENQATIIKNLQEENKKLKEKIAELELQYDLEDRDEDKNRKDRKDYFDR